MNQRVIVLLFQALAQSGGVTPPVGGDDAFDLDGEVFDLDNEVFTLED